MERRIARLRAKSETPLVDLRGWLYDARIPLAAVAFMTIGSCVALALVLPGALVMPALGILLILCAACTAVIAFAVRSDRSAAGFTAWDAAGLLAFFGCCAAMLSESAQILSLLEGQLAHLEDPFPRDPPI